VHSPNSGITIESSASPETSEGDVTIDGGSGIADPAEEDIGVSPLALAELELGELRRYRQGLLREEEKVSYWRRVTQARLDVLATGAFGEGSLNKEQLVQALGTTGSGQSRRALMSVRAAEPLPDVPSLDEVWITGAERDDEVVLSAAAERLQCTERQLTAYRHALHTRLDAATNELILRYQADLSSVFVAFDA
jgi:RsiG-like